MKNQITHLHIENFKSIKSIDLDCRRINVFVGRPNVGKSNILEALSLYSAGYASDAKFLSEFIRYESFDNLFYDSDRGQMVRVESNLGNCFLIFEETNENYHFIYINGKYPIVNFKSDIRYEDFIRKYFTGEQTIRSIPSFGNMVIYNDGKTSQVSRPNFPVKKYSFNTDALNSNVLYSHPFLYPPFGENLVSILISNSELRKEISILFKEYGLDLVINIKEKKLAIQKK